MSNDGVAEHRDRGQGSGVVEYLCVAEQHALDDAAADAPGIVCDVHISSRGKGFQSADRVISGDIPDAFRVPPTVGRGNSRWKTAERERCRRQ